MLILNDEGMEYANIEIPINKEFKQEVFEIKASSYRLSESGAISETKLNRKEIITEKFNDDITLKKFSIPGVNSGTILEYSYRKKMGNPFMLPDWEFHDYLPVQWSEYKMQIPVGLHYKMIFKGTDSLEVYEVNKALVSTVSNRNQGSYIFRMVKKDLPPVEDLPYMMNRDRLTNFYKYPPAQRRIIYTNNLIESNHRMIGKVTKKSVFTSEKPLLNKDI